MKPLTQPTQNIVSMAVLKIFAEKFVFSAVRISTIKRLAEVLTVKKRIFGKKRRASRWHYILRRLRRHLHISIFRSRFPNYFSGINFESSHTSYKRINTVDLSLAHINYGLKIFMRETKFVLIYIFSILRSFNGYWCHCLKIPVKPKIADKQSYSMNQQPKNDVITSKNVRKF